MNSLKKNIVNASLYNIGWLACVYGGNEIAIVTGLVIFTVHFLWIKNHPYEWLIILSIMCLGILVDSIWFYTGIIQNHDQSLLIPLWLIVLWAIFATTLNNCLQWFQQHLGMVAVIGAVVGPLFYWLGAGISDVKIAEPLVQSLIMIGIAWLFLLPTLFIITRKIRSIPCYSN